MKQICQDLKGRCMSFYRTRTTEVSACYLSDDTPVNLRADFLWRCSAKQQRHVVASGDGLRQTVQELLVETLLVHSSRFNWKPEKVELFNGTVTSEHLYVVCRRNLIKDE